MIKIYTDGSCIGNPGKGGWAAIIIDNKKIIKISGKTLNTTNNQMELLAPIKALSSLSKKGSIVVITDSLYVKEGITNWIKIWQKNDWKNSRKKSVKNKNLWQKLNNLVKIHNVKWKWVKGHSTDSYNNLADEMARKAALKN